MKKVKLFEEFFKGGVANGMSAQDLADKHKLPVEEIESALAKGQKVEVEHTNDSKKAYEIAKDHIFEDPKYYDKLSTIEEKKITISWNDDDNSMVFSDGEIARVDYDGAFKYRDEWFETYDHEGPEDLIRDLQKRFKRDKFEWISESYISEGKVKVFLDKIVANMVSGAFGPSSNYKMREEIKQKIEAVVKETLEKYDYVVENELYEKNFQVVIGDEAIEYTLRENLAGNGIIALASSGKDLDKEIESGASKTAIAKDIEDNINNRLKRMKQDITVSVDYRHEGAGYGFKLNLDGLLQKLNK